jgi:hypothetical protein
MPVAFLTDEEHALFKTRYHPRRIRRGHDRPPDKLEAVVAGLIASAQKNTARLGLHQAACVIRAYRNDGLSWTAERLAEIVAERLPSCRVFEFDGEIASYRLPEVVRHVGLRRSLRAFARAGLYDAQIWRKVAIDAAAIVVAIVLAFLSGLDRSPNPNTSSNIAYYVAIASVLAAILANHVRLERPQGALEDLARRLDNGNAATGDGRSGAAYDRAVERLTAEFHHLDHPACVIVDDFARLDGFTQAVLLKAMRANETDGQGLVLWIVLEQIETGLLSRETVLRPASRSEYAEGRFEICDLEPLEIEENEAILRANGLDLARARDGLFVRSLVKGANADEIDQLTAILDTLRQTEASTAGLLASTLFRVVAANNHRHGFELSTSEYERIFTERTGEGKRRLFPILLQTHVGVPHLPKDRASELLQAVHHSLGRLLMPVKAPSEPIRVRQISAVVLDRWPHTQIPKEAIELFWFIWWYRARPPQTGSTAVLQKLAAHARHARLDAKLLASTDGPALATETIHALMQVTDACLQVTLFVDAVHTAESLLANVRGVLGLETVEAEAMTDHTWSSLARVCWQVYLASGDESFLIKLLALLADGKFVAQGSAAKTAHDVVLSYLGVINTAGDEVGTLGDALQRLLARDARLATRLRAHMQCRTLDAVSLCQRFSSPSLIEKAGFPSYATANGAIDSNALVKICEGIYSDTDHQFTILDHFVLRDALRHVVRNKDVETAKQIVPVFILPPEQRATPNAGRAVSLTLLERAFRLQALAGCLDALLRLAVALQPGSRPRYQFQPPDSDAFAFRTDIQPGPFVRDIQDALDAARDVLGGKPLSAREGETLSPKVLTRVDDLYLHSSLAWEELGLEQLRNRTLMDRANFLLEFTDAEPTKPEKFRRIIQGLGPALSAPGIQTVLYHLELAEFFESVRQMRSVYVTEAVSRLLKFGVASDLALVFCTFLNHLPMVDTMDSIGAVQHVVDLLSDPQSLDHFAQRFGSDPAVGFLLNNLVGVGERNGNGVLRDRTFHLLETLIEHPALAPEVASALETLRDFYFMRRGPRPSSAGEVSALLEQWDTRRDHWLYPSVLGYALAGQPDDRDLLDASFTLLESGDRVFNGSPAVTLAHRLAAIAISSEDAEFRKRAAAVLTDHVAPIAGRWEIETAVETFQLLMVLDQEANFPHHLAQHAHWTQMVLERDRVEAFAHRLHEGHFFGVFKSYWDGLKIYQLPSVSLDRPWCETLERLLKSDRQAAIQFCLERMRNAPPPLVATPHNVGSIVLDFVNIGEVLFSRDAPAEEVEFATRVINRTVGNDLRRVLDIILACDTVPATLREFIRDHRKEVEDETARRLSAA